MTKHTSHTLSQRGQDLAENPARIDMELFMEAADNLYHSEDNPTGTFVLNVAENSLVSPIIKKRFEQMMQSQSLPDWTLKYTSTLGHPEVLEVIADFMRTHFGSQAITSENLAFSAGASASLEVCSFILGNPQEVVVIPAPAYPMYTKDLGIKSQLERIDLQRADTEKGKPLSLVNIAALEEAWEEIEAKGKVFKILLLTSPDNPTGAIYTKDQLFAIADWCISKEIHLVLNEIYAFSQIDTTHSAIQSDYEALESYYSFTKVMEQLQSDYLHLIYGLSKDFGISGFRFGLIHSLNESFIVGLSNANIPHLVSNLTQWLVGELFKDKAFIAKYIDRNTQLITENYVVAVQALREMGVSYTPSRGSLFVWADFSRFLKTNDAQGEEELWVDIYRNTGVLLTPGKGFMHQKFGLFRIVHTVVPAAELAVAMQRLVSYGKKK